MELEYIPPTEIGRQRHAWYKQRAKPSMSFEENFRLNEEALRLFPASEEERRLKTKSLLAMPEFVLC